MDNRHFDDKFLGNRELFPIHRRKERNVRPDKAIELATEKLQFSESSTEGLPVVGETKSNLARREGRKEMNGAHGYSKEKVAKMVEKHTGRVPVSVRSQALIVIATFEDGNKCFRIEELAE